jgi:hypothetical protein
VLKVLAAIAAIQFSHQEQIMSNDKIDPSKKEQNVSSDDLTKTTKKGDVELSEEELKRVAGGLKSNLK